MRKVPGPRLLAAMLRVWQDLRERDDALKGFAGAQLETFTKNLAKELEVEPCRRGAGGAFGIRPIGGSGRGERGVER